MIYPLLGSITFGAAGLYFGYHLKRQQKQPVVIEQNETIANHTFSVSTVKDYIEKKKEDNKIVIYSKYHKCPLATVEHLDQYSILPKIQTIIQPIQTQTNLTKRQEKGEVSSKISQSQDQKTLAQKQIENPLRQIANKQMYQRIFKTYGKDLISSHTCDSVQLIYGPIFSKDTPYKVKQQVFKNVYVSHLKMTPEGQFLTDRYYTIVICDNKSGRHFNGFTYRRSNYGTFRFLNYLTSLKKIQEQTGFVFNIKGSQLSLIDYQNIVKQRLYEQFQKIQQPQRQQKQQQPEKAV